MPKIYDLNDFANQCGYFYNAYLTPKDPNDKTFCPGRDPSPNNGYNCRHPDCGEVQDGVGCCFAWSCPLGYEADQEDCDNPDIDNDGYTECEEGQFIIPNEDWEASHE